MAGVVVIAGTAFLFTLLTLDVGDVDEPSSIQRWLGRLTDAAAQDPWLWYGGGGA